ncbi:MAG TPA: nucleotidyl transferase AbiEii/AbiGii toxin family protein [Pseudobdellovibrionaceae bacterium]|jgi:predicted nucleotidyltransferase component of viral defense system
MKPKNVAASVAAKLLKHSKDSGRNYNEILVYYGIERFLARLSKSKFNSQFVLKGAMALHVLNADLARSTRDIDFLAFESNDPDKMKKIISLICEINLEDGVLFDLKSLETEIIKEDAEYQGVRVSFLGKLEKAEIPLQVDIAVGDTMTPKPEELAFPVILGNGFRLKVYPKETVIAEKLQAMVLLDMLNSRMKDFFDIWFLATNFSFDGDLLQKAIEATFKNRETDLVALPTALTPEFYLDKNKTLQWSAFRKRIANSAPESLEEVCKIVFNFAGPILEASAARDKFAMKWNAPEWR